MAGRKNGLDREARARMRSLVERFTMPPHLARLVATGDRGLSDALLDMQRTEVAERLLAEAKIGGQEASLVRLGRLTPDEAQFRKRLREHKNNPGYAISRLGGLLEEDVVLATLGGRRVQGRLTGLEPFEVTLETADGASTLAKHDLKLAFLGAHRKRLVKRGITWGDLEARLEPGDLKLRANRRDIKARDLLLAMEGERLVTWITAEDDRLRGRVTGFNRFEVVLETTQGTEALLFRHAFGGMDLGAPGG